MRYASFPTVHFAEPPPVFPTRDTFLGGSELLGDSIASLDISRCALVLSTQVQKCAKIADFTANDTDKSYSAATAVYFLITGGPELRAQFQGSSWTEEDSTLLVAGSGDDRVIAFVQAEMVDGARGRTR